MVSKQWVEKALLDGDLPKQFEIRVRELMQKAASNGVFAGLYMPELKNRGFDKIVWDKKFHDMMKLN